MPSPFAFHTLVFFIVNFPAVTLKFIESPGCVRLISLPRMLPGRRMGRQWLFCRKGSTCPQGLSAVLAATVESQALVSGIGADGWLAPCPTLCMEGRSSQTWHSNFRGAPRSLIYQAIVRIRTVKQNPRSPSLSSASSASSTCHTG